MSGLVQLEQQVRGENRQARLDEQSQANQALGQQRATDLAPIIKGLGLGGGGQALGQAVGSADPGAAGVGLGLLEQLLQTRSPAFAPQQEANQLGIQQARASIANTQASTAANFSQIAVNNARLMGIPATQRLALEAAERDIIADQVKTTADLQKSLQGNDAIAVGLNGIRRRAQLMSTLQDPNASALDLVNAAVLMTQVIEPGLATRNDDRMAVETGASPGLVNLTNQINQLLGGEVDIQTATTNILRTVDNLLQPISQGTQQSLEFWRNHATNIPGLPPGTVDALLGLDPALRAELEALGTPDI